MLTLAFVFCLIELVPKCPRVQTISQGKMLIEIYNLFNETNRNFVFFIVSHLTCALVAACHIYLYSQLFCLPYALMKESKRKFVYHIEIYDNGCQKEL